MNKQVIPIGQGPAVEVTDKDFDKLLYTNPNLYRQIVDNNEQTTDPAEVAPREYSLSIHGTDSYLSIKTTVHDELSTTNEIP